MTDVAPGPGPLLVWLRRELRLADNPVLDAAVASGRPLVIVFVLDDTSPGLFRQGAASRWWLHHSLESLARDIADRGNRLVLRRGRFEQVIPALAAEIGAAAVHAGLPTEPWARVALRAVKAALPVSLHTHLSTLLHRPDALRTQAGTPFGVFTPFARACLAQGDPLPSPPAAARLPPGPAIPSEVLDDWALLPRRPDWAGGLRAAWSPGEATAAARLDRFAAAALADYAERRDLPGEDGTSRLSPHLAFGEISPRAVWHAAAGETFRAELLWREFSAHLLWHHQDLPTAPLRRQFAAMPWRDDSAGLAAWQRGRTGVPIVDAGMRQLWHTGWMHNRVRMIVASFLVKHLLIDWRHGEAWFRDTLVDADLASNSASWQWVAGCGADAAPFFRVFNPVLQGRKFDPHGAYVRRWVDELGDLPDAAIHAPWEAPALLRPRCYPAPLVDLAAGRARALATFATISGRGLEATPGSD
jgi:deoxyribodipyrimidine photo-lyase